MPRRSSIITASAALVMLGIASAGPSLGQGSDTGSSLTQDRRGATRDPSGSGTKSSVVHVGAGTTNASTTGYSGATDQSAKPPGQIDVPPVPSPDLCEAFKDSVSYGGCLEVVLRKDGRGG